MTYDQFVSLVRRMREAQKAYFKHRTSLNLRLALELEREVDKVLVRLEEPDSVGHVENRA